MWKNNPKVNPVIHDAVTDAASATALDFNAQERIMVSNIKKEHPGLDIRFFGTFDKLNKLHQQQNFANKTTQYQMCVGQLANTDLEGFISSPVLACSTNQQDYMFWNGTHMTAKTNEYIADQLDKTLEGSNNLG